MKLRKFLIVAIGLFVVTASAVLTFSVFAAKNSTESAPTNYVSAAASNSTTRSSATTVPTTLPAMAVGTHIALPFDNMLGMTLLYTDIAPAISQQGATQIVYHFLGNQQDWALGNGGKRQGKTVTVTAHYGAATFGGLTKDGKTWGGLQNVHVRSCDNSGKCSANGQVLKHLENRPMWILDYVNVEENVPAPMCMNQSCTPISIPPTNHVVYAVDIQTNSVVSVQFY